MKKTHNNRKTPETQRVENSQKFQGGNKNPDKEIVRKSGIPSPDITQMPFKVQEGKTTRFFASKEKYEHYMKKQIR